MRVLVDFIEVPLQITLKTTEGGPPGTLKNNYENLHFGMVIIYLYSNNGSILILLR